MELTSKTRKQFVFVDTHRCYYMSIVIWISYMPLGIKFREDLFSRVINFSIFLEFSRIRIRIPIARRRFHHVPGLFSLFSFILVNKEVVA